MGRPPALPAEKKVELVLSVLTGQQSASEAARVAGVSEQSISNWKRQFVEAGQLGLTGEVVTRDAAREEELAREISVLKDAMAELYIELRQYRRHARRRNATPEMQEVRRHIIK